MRYDLFANRKDELLLLARILLMVLFVKFGLDKLTGFTATVTYMTSTGMPLPGLLTLIAVVMEFVVGILIVLGFYTRPLALALAIYTLAAALIGHRYWNMEGMAHYLTRWICGSIDAKKSSGNGIREMSRERPRSALW